MATDFPAFGVWCEDRIWKARYVSRDGRSISFAERLSREDAVVMLLKFYEEDN